MRSVRCLMKKKYFFGIFVAFIMVAMGFFFVRGKSTKRHQANHVSFVCDEVISKNDSAVSSSSSKSAVLGVSPLSRVMKTDENRIIKSMEDRELNAKESFKILKMILSMQQGQPFLEIFHALEDVLRERDIPEDFLHELSVFAAEPPQSSEMLKIQAYYLLDKLSVYQTCMPRSDDAASLGTSASWWDRLFGGKRGSLSRWVRVRKEPADLLFVLNEDLEKVLIRVQSVSSHCAHQNQDAIDQLAIAVKKRKRMDRMVDELTERLEL